MATSLATHNLNIQDSATTQQTVGGLAVEYPVNPAAFRSQLSEGTGEGQANDQVYYTGSVASGTPVTLDLTAFVGPFGNVAFSAVKELVVYNDSTTAGQYLTINASGSNLFSYLFAAGSRVYPGPGIALSYTPTSNPPAVDATHCNLVIASATGTIAFRVAVRGLH